MFGLFKKDVLLPWVGMTPIYDFIKSTTNKEGIVEDEKLPDDDVFWEGKGVRWVTGGIDGAFGHHAAGKVKEVDKVKELIQLIRKQSNKPNNKTRRDTYIKLLEEDVLGMIDTFLDAIQKQHGLSLNDLYNEALWFAEKGTHRNVVKFGIALLGRFDMESHKELLMTVGKHEEFTLYAAVAITNSLTNSNDLLFQLAKCLKGWGKISLVERLVPENAEIKDWLLRKGCYNVILNEYLAYTCAVKGDLHIALTSKSIDHELFVGAGEIIAALINGGPAENIDDYEHSKDIIGEYLRHAQYQCTTIVDFNTILHIHSFVADAESDWKTRYENGWSQEIRDYYLELAQEIIKQEKWSVQVREMLDKPTEERQLKGQAIQAAKGLKLDIWFILFSQLENDVLNSSLYYELMQSKNTDRIHKLVEFAESHLPLELIGTGPADHMGMGPGFEPHQCLDFILQDLHNHVSVGGKLITAALNSPVTRNRNFALKALEAWPVESWEGHFHEMIKELDKIEPTDLVKERISNLLQNYEKKQLKE